MTEYSGESRAATIKLHEVRVLDSAIAWADANDGKGTTQEYDARKQLELAIYELRLLLRERCGR